MVREVSALSTMGGAGCISRAPGKKGSAGNTAPLNNVHSPNISLNAEAREHAFFLRRRGYSKRRKNMKSHGTLVFFCGKMGAGKSTKSRPVAAEKNAVLLSEDEWLSSLYPGQITNFDDYLKYSAQLKPLIKAHVKNILSTGTNVVMDFPANTRSQRQWFLDLVSEIDAKHELIYLNISNEQCLQQIAQRRLQHPERALFDTEAVFNQVTQYFEAPSESEGLNIVYLEGNA